MPILPPGLDDRRFDDLVAEMLARIPAHTPEWTHPRQGDPGRTMIELFAWLADTLLYRANLVPERQRLVFLKLLGQPLRPARAARGVVALAYAQDDMLEATPLAPGGRIEGPVPFEMLNETTVLPVSAEVYYKRRLDDAESARMASVLQGLASIHRLSGAPRGYQTTPLFDGGRVDPAGRDVFAESADRALWIALLAPRAPGREQQPAFNKRAAAAIGGGTSAAPSLLSVGVVPALAIPQPLTELSARAPVPVIWEITSPGTPGDTDYLTLSPVPGEANDTTRGLTGAGVLRLQMPDEKMLFCPSNDVLENPRAGVGNMPPRLDDEEKAARLVAWIRLRPHPDQPDVSLRLSWLGINATEIDQRVTLGGRVLGISNGAADQVFALPQGSVDPDSLVLQVDEPGQGYQTWHRVDDLAAISADPQVARMAAAFELDAEAGSVRCGDGIRARIPEAQMRVRLARGRFGGGRAGNLPAGTLTELTGRRIDNGKVPPIRVLQPLPTLGGEDAETLDDAQRRIPGLLRHHDRAVTADDYRRLALQVPGLEVGRVEVLPRFKPRDRRFDVPGVVSVMALPARPLAAAPNPRPDRPFIETLHAFLASRVPLATELYVIGCEYVALGLSVGVTIRDGHGRDQVLHEVREALKRLLWPLPPGGGDFRGWGLGRDVRDRELEVEVSRVPGVLEVTGLKLFERQAIATGDKWKAVPRNAQDGSQQLVLTPWQLPELLSVVVADGDASDALTPPPNPFADDLSVAVPVVPEVC